MKKKPGNLAISLLILLLHACPGKAQQFVFNRVPLFEENVRGFITSIAQDSKGYMWFTGTSLYRYDGYRVVTFKHDPNNTNSLSPSRLETIYIDHNDIIWLGTFSSGLDRFDPATGIFTHYQNNPDDTASLSNNLVTAILEDIDGNLWVGTHGGLNLLDKKSGKFTRFQKKINDSTTLSNDQVRVIYQDKKGVIWVGCGSPYNNETPEGEGGLNRIDKATGKFKRYLHDPNNPNTLLDNKVRTIYEDSRGVFWVGTFGDGLHTMDRENGTFRRYPYDPLHSEKLSSPQEKGDYDGVSFITEDKAGGIWIGGFLAGLNHFDPKTSKLTRFKGESNNEKALGENTVWNAAFSKEGILWITTQSNVYRIDPLRKNISHTETKARVNAFYEDASGILWMASDTGLIRNDKRNKTTQYLVNDPKDAGSLSSNVVGSVYEDRKGMLWIGTANGLDLYNRQTNKFIRYQHDDKNSNTISKGGIFSMLEDSQGSFWIATDNGLDMMNTQTGSFRHYRHNTSDTNSLSSNAVFRIMEDNSGNIWLATWSSGGLNLLDRKTGHFKHYLQGSNIVAMLQDSEGTIWIGTQFGLYRKDNNVNEFSAYSEPASEIGTANVASIIEDDQKNLWIGSQSAIIKLDLRRNETAIYGRKYGVIPNSIYDLVGYKNSSGELFFGDASGYYSFFPKDLTNNAIPPQLQITDFKIADVSIKPGQPPFTKPIEQTDEIRLNYKQNIFSLDFAAMHYSSIEENRHLFMLEDYDKKWRKAGSEKTASYFNVPPGKYIFRVKASGSDGIWVEKKLTIIISPPWWLTWWAYALYAVLIAAIVWSIVYYRSRSLLKEKKLLEQQVALRTEQIVKQKEEIAIQRDDLEHTLLELKSTQDHLVQREKMASLGELTAGIAHEINNPMNFVKNFAEVSGELLKEMDDHLDNGHISEVKIISEEVKANLEKIVHHGETADAIVQGMLQHAGGGTGKKELTDLNTFTDEYFHLCFNRLKAKDKTFHARVQTDFDDKAGEVNIVPEDVGKVLLNIIGNSFYAVAEKKKQLGDDYEPIVTVSTKAVKPPLGGLGVLISIKDNGIGIPQKFLNKIFQPFFTTKPTGQGTGLGLSLSYNIIKAHGGEINVETKEGEGSEFTIQLPVV